MDENNGTVRIIVWPRVEMVGKSFGHVALVTSNNRGLDLGKLDELGISESEFRKKEKDEPQLGIYVSFWPGHKYKKPGDGGCQKKGSHFHTRDEDDLEYPDSIDLDGRHKPSEELINVDIEAVHKKYVEMRKEMSEWRLLPYFRGLFFSDPAVQNCASFVYELLKSGGMRDRVGLIHKQIKSSFVYGVTIGVSAVASLFLFNTLSKYSDNDLGSGVINLGGVAIFWIALARISLSSLETVKVLTITTPSDILSNAKELNKNDENQASIKAKM